MRKRRPQSKSPKTDGYIFQYVQFHGRTYPLIPVSLRFKSRRVNTFALLDSGASICIFQPEIAKALQLPKSRKTVRMGTPVGGVNIYLSDVELRVKGARFPSEVGFSKEYAGGFNILGREGFFDNFHVCFDEKKQRVRLIPFKGK